MLVSLVVSLLAVGQTLAVIPCILTNSTIPPANATINVSCTDVVFVNVVAQGNMMINLSVTAMVAANPNITVSIKNLSLLDGAVLVVDSSGYSDGMTSSLPRLSILLQSLEQRRTCLPRHLSWRDLDTRERCKHDGKLCRCTKAYPV